METANLKNIVKMSKTKIECMNNQHKTSKLEAKDNKNKTKTKNPDR